MNFHGLVYHEEEIKSKNVRSMVRKIEQYIDFLKENPDLASNPSRLVERENNIEALYAASPGDVSYIRELIEKNNGYLRFKPQSKGYSIEDLNKKIQILYKLYSR